MPVTATRTTTFRPATGDQDGDGFVDFGDVLRHTLVISNTGTAATGVVVNDPLNGSTLTGTVDVSPLALDDSFTAVGNTLLVVGGTNLSGGPASVVAGNLFSNDVEFFGDTFSLTGNTAAANGSVTVNADGTFTYISNAGFEGVDTFTNTISDSQGLSSVGTVSIAVGGAAGQVWYVDSAYSGVNGASNGTSLRPYTSLTQLNGVTGDGTTNDDVDGVNDFIHVRGGTTGSGLVLEDGQQLVGTGANLVVGGFTLATATSNSSVSSAAGFTLTLASGNTLTGLNVGNSIGAGT